MEQKNVVVLFGGQSSEHEVSCVSVVTVINNINKEDYNLTMVGITKEGKWLLASSIKDIETGEWKKSDTEAIISPDATKKELVITNKNKITRKKIDVVFPVLHGLYGEDGTIQGLLELAKIPYVGCGVLASSVSMDKLYTKIIVDTLGIRQAKYVAVRRKELENMVDIVSKVENQLPYPVFVKPSNSGSSKGVSRANNAKELMESLINAGENDSKILVEETIVGREVECAVLGAGDIKASGVGEILAAEEATFYDYEAKYHNSESKTVINPELPDGVTEQIRKNAVEIFKAVDGFGLARVDFFVEKDTNEIVFNEINTLPGFTSISMYPMLWEARGISKENLVEKLIQFAFLR